VAGWMDKVKRDGRMEVSSTVLGFARRDFLAERVDDNQVSFAFTASANCSYNFFFLDFRNNQDVLSKVLHSRSSYCRRSISSGHCQCFKVGIAYRCVVYDLTDG
jgi:hypothetical protein